MGNELEEIIDDTIEDIGMEAVTENDQDNSDRPRWETWVALSSSLLAVVSAIAALLATFESDKAAMAESAENFFAVYQRGAVSNYDLLHTKLDILAAVGRPNDPETLDQLAQAKEEMESLQAKVEEYDNLGRDSYENHDHLAIAVTLFQLSILLGGLAALLRVKKVWLFGMLFTVIGGGFMLYGLLGLAR
jgi:hypothetical protein